MGNYSEIPRLREGVFDRRGFVLDDLALVRELELSQTEAAMEVQPGVGVANGKTRG